MAAVKKRKVDLECRVFQEKWTNEYFFVLVKDNPVCLICLESVSVLKDYNLKRHYTSKHSNYENYKGQARTNLIDSLKKNFVAKQIPFHQKSAEINLAHQSFFSHMSTEAEKILRASYAVSFRIAQRFKPISDGEFVKECISEVVSILCPEKKKVVDSISLSCRTVSDHIDDISDDIEQSLTGRCRKFETFSLALDETIVSIENVQLAIFVRGVDAEFNITEEMLALQIMNVTATEEDILQVLKSVMNKFSLSFEKLYGISTEGAPFIVGSESGLIARIKQEMMSLNLDTSQLVTFNCTIHPQSLFLKSIKVNEIMSSVVSCINFIKAEGHNHPEFQDFLNNLDSEHGAHACYAEVHWLSKGSLLKHFYNLKDEVFLFMEVKGKLMPELKSEMWLADLAFLVDIMNHLDELSAKLQVKGQVRSHLYSLVKSFQVKLRFWESQLRKNNTCHFPTLANHQETSDLVCYAEELSLLSIAFSQSFAGFSAQELSVQISVSPFSVVVDTVPAHLQMELIDLQENDKLKFRFSNMNTIDFYKSILPKEDFPQLLAHARKVASLFSSTYVCEQFSSRSKFTELKVQSNLSDERLENNFRIATTSIPPNIDTLIKRKQSQK